jgi:ribonuclease D
VENLITPDFVRRLMWEPPEADEHELPEALAGRLRELGAREWQVELSVDLLAHAVLTAEAVAAEKAAALEPSADDD